MKQFTAPLLLIAALALTACEDKKADAFLGKWQGPEGTFLEITKADEGYTVTVQNLDGPRTFPATANSAGIITFDRDGKTEAITKGTGAETGMKWLADKTDCVVVKKGEGYCRD